MTETIYEKLVAADGFSPAQKIIIDLTLANSTVLEIGSSSGYLTKEFKSKGCLVEVVEMDKKALIRVKKIADKTFEGSIEQVDVQKKINKKYDFIVCADVLEHLVNPGLVLEFLKSRLTDQGFILISIPNVAFWDMRKQLFFKGDFEYQESGLLDKTHLRFYSLNNFLNLLRFHNLKVNNLIPAQSRFPLEQTVKNIPILGVLLIKLFKNRIINFWPNLTYYHYVIKASVKN